MHTAYALPCEHTHIVLLYDRVLNSVDPDTVPALLGHVLAHEGVNVHSASGIMKEHWNSKDFADMHRGRLKFTRDDLDLIDHGLQWRAAHALWLDQYQK